MYRNARLDAMEATNLDLPKDFQYSVEDVLERPIEL